MLLYVYPFLLALYPILFLYSENLGEVEPADLLVPLAVVLVATAVVFGFAWGVTRDRGRAALATSLILVVVFAFGRVEDATEGTALSTAVAPFLSTDPNSGGTPTTILQPRIIRLAAQFRF